HPLLDVLWPEAVGQESHCPFATWQTCPLTREFAVWLFSGPFSSHICIPTKTEKQPEKLPNPPVEVYDGLGCELPSGTTAAPQFGRLSAIVIRYEVNPSKKTSRFPCDAAAKLKAQAARVLAEPRQEKSCACGAQAKCS